MQAAASGDTGQTLSRFKLLDRQVINVELLSSREKLMAGLLSYATCFGRDMMMSAMMLVFVMKSSMLEHMTSAVLRSFVLPLSVGLFVNGLGTLSPARYEFSCDIQLWNLTDLAVQFEYDRLISESQKRR